MHFCRFNTGPRKAFEWKAGKFLSPAPFPVDYHRLSLVLIWNLLQFMARSWNFFHLVKLSRYRLSGKTFTECTPFTRTPWYLQWMLQSLPHSSQTFSTFLSTIATLQNIKILSLTLFELFNFVPRHVPLIDISSWSAIFVSPAVYEQKASPRKQRLHSMSSVTWYSMIRYLRLNMHALNLHSDPNSTKFDLHRRGCRKLSLRLRHQAIHSRQKFQLNKSMLHCVTWKIWQEEVS